MQQCFRVDSDGNAIATMEGGVEPAIFVLPSIHHAVDYFIPQAGLKVPFAPASPHLGLLFDEPIISSHVLDSL